MPCRLSSFEDDLGCFVVVYHSVCVDIFAEGNSLTVGTVTSLRPILQLCMLFIFHIQVAASGIRRVIVPNLDPRALGRL